jgi:hypothetical protein
MSKYDLNKWEYTARYIIFLIGCFQIGKWLGYGISYVIANL